jgi:hypothetical protein
MKGFPKLARVWKAFRIKEAISEFSSKILTAPFLFRAFLRRGMLLMLCLFEMSNRFWIPQF